MPEKIPFYSKLKQAWLCHDSLVCVGLDPDMGKIPAKFKTESYPLFTFNREIIDATADQACAFKPQIAYYAAQGREKDLELTFAYLRDKYPGLITILDAKRNDIGSTASMYALEAFDRYGADAVTVNPYLGGDSLAPFSENSSKGIFILCRTSNPGAPDIQDLEAGGEKIYQHVARKAAREWNSNKNVGLVVGATYPDELREVRDLAGSLPLLVPGIGAQGGDLRAVLRNGLDSNNAGLLINSSRGIIYAGEGKECAGKARDAARNLKNEINRIRY